jgi:hypothetical protein
MEHKDSKFAGVQRVQGMSKYPSEMEKRERTDESYLNLKELDTLT